MTRALRDYPVIMVADDNDTIMLTFPDVPEAVTFGRDEAEALAQAPDALATALSGYIQDRRDLPMPSKGQRSAALPLIAAMKLAVYQAMRERGWRKADLARELAVNPRQIDRLLDLFHATPVAQIEAALRACGKRASVELLAA